jgi:hypothetical protein
MGRTQNFGGTTNEWIVPMSCWPPCSGWCECVGNECRQAPLKPNAVRIRTDDGRYRRGINGPTTYLGYLGPTSNAPGPWDTFLIDQPMTWPVRSGDLMVLHAIDDSWRPLTDVLVRVDHGVLTLPKKGKKDPQLVSYQFGGSDLSVLVSSPLSPGYLAYRANDPLPPEPAARLSAAKSIGDTRDQDRAAGEPADNRGPSPAPSGDGQPVDGRPSTER